MRFIHRYDSFNRGDESPILTPSDDGSDWVAGPALHTGTTGVVSNQAANVTSGTASRALECNHKNGKASCVIATQGASEASGLLLRFIDFNNYYVMQGVAATGYRLTKVDAGVGSTVSGPFGPLPGDGDVIEVAMNNTVFETRINDVLVDTVSDSGPVGTKHGLIIVGSDAFLDNWDFLSQGTRINNDEWHDRPVSVGDGMSVTGP